MTSQKEEKNQKEEIDCKRCEKYKSKAMQSALLSFLSQKTVELGVEPTITCQPCSPDRAGGYSPSNGIILCSNSLLSTSHTTDILAHEFIHLYDDLTTKVKWNNLHHLACSEIRAISLSGECKWTREIMRGHFGFAKQFQECIKRRSLLGVSQSPICKDKETAALAIAAVWDSCFPDTAPFDEVY